MDPSFWEVVTAVGVIATALVTAVFGYLRRRDTAVYNLPDASISQGRSQDGSRWIEFRISNAEGRPQWVVTNVGVKPIWRRRRLMLPAACAEYLGTGTGRTFLGYRPLGRWQRRITYGSPVRQGVVLIHPDDPSDSVLFAPIGAKLAVEPQEPVGGLA